MSPRCVLVLLIALSLILFWGAMTVRAEEFLVGLRLAPEAGAAALETARTAVAQEVTALAGRVEYSYRLIPALLIDLPPEAAAQLANDSHVEYVEPNGRVSVPEAAGLGWQQERIEFSFEWLPWGVKRIGANIVHHPPRKDRSAAWLMILPFAWLVPLLRRAWWHRLLLLCVLLALGLTLSGCGLIYIRVRPATIGFEGAGARVALLDTGIDMQHFDLKDNYRGGYDFVNDDAEPLDDNGHGTEVAGVLAARENGLGLIGVAPQVGIWAVKVLDASAQGAISDLVKGLEWAVEHKMQIVNMSLGTPDDYQTLRQAVRAAWEAGLLLVAPSGNNSGQVLYPAAYPEVIAVSATDKDDKLAWFSNTGPQIELAAPGAEIPTTYPGNKYRLADGTSFAAPHVTGVAALLISAGIQDNKQIRARLDGTAQDLNLPVAAQGYGLVDAQRAVLGD